VREKVFNSMSISNGVGPLPGTGSETSVAKLRINEGSANLFRRRGPNGAASAGTEISKACR